MKSRLARNECRTYLCQRPSLAKIGDTRFESLSQKNILALDIAMEDWRGFHLVQVLQTICATFKNLDRSIHTWMSTICIGSLDEGFESTPVNKVHDNE